MSDLPQRHLLIVEPGKIATVKHGYMGSDERFVGFVKEVIAHYPPRSPYLGGRYPRGRADHVGDRSQ